MKIYFEKHKNRFYYHYYDSYQDDKRFGSAYMSYETKNKIRDAAKLVFKSSSFYVNKDYFEYVSFKDKADEAFFQVWSSDGIEI